VNEGTNGETTMKTRNAVHCGYVLDAHGNVFVQLPADCERLGWLLYESRGPDAHPEGCSCGDPDCPAFLATQSW
jgi:hypothetical protein